MNTASAYLMNVILVSRLVFAFGDEPLSRKQLVLMFFLQLAGLLALEWNAVWIVLVLVLVNLDLLLYVLEQRWHRTYAPRLVSLLLYGLVASLFCSPALGLGFHTSLAAIGQWLGHIGLLLQPNSRFDGLHLQVTLLGFLLATSEANLLIRTLLQAFSIAPHREEQSAQQVVLQVDRRELNAGRIIGILERTLIFYFVLNAQYAAIGFILAAKSFTRFRELEKREFAEYMLVGTLLSALLALLAAGLVRLFLPKIS